MDRHQAVTALKKLVYGARGEPYRIAGHRLHYTPGTRPVRTSYATATDDDVSKFDALEIQLLASRLRAGDQVLDVGAHAGQYAILCAALVGQTGRVVAFEPDPHARRLLAGNIALNPGIVPPTVESLAASDTNGQAVLMSKGGNANSSLAAAVPGTAQLETIAVTTVRLDDYIAQHGLKPTWAKIDTEGAEIRVLRGARKLLAGGCNILVELHPYAWAAFGDGFEEMRAMVSASGRRMRYLDETAELTGVPRYGVVLLERAHGG